MNFRITLEPNFLDKLKIALNGKLPGPSSHQKMASRVRLNAMKSGTDTSTAIQSSVLILLYPNNNKIYSVFILRQTYDGVHSGQVSFPGGRTEPSDTSLVNTALREASEEINIAPDEVHILGTLTELYIPPSNFLVLPVLAYTHSRPDFKPDPFEVAEIIESDLSFLDDPALRKETTLNVRGVEIEAPYFEVQGKIVWGATAMILSELKDILSSITSS